MGYTYNMKKIITIGLLLTILFPATSAQASTKPLNTKGNKTACKNIKTNYKSETMSKWTNGVASDNDVLKEIQSNIDMLISKQKPTTGKVKTTISSWINIEKNTKTSLIEKNIEGITSAMNLKINVITKFDKICKSIGQ